MSVNMFLKLDGVTGESIDAAFPAWIALDSFSFGANNTVAIGSGHTGAAAGKVSLSTFNVMKRTDSSSAVLFQNCCSGKHFATAQIVCNKSGGEKALKFLTYDFKELYTESIQWSMGAGGDETPIEAISFAFKSVYSTYVPQKADGTAGSPVAAGWDVSTNSKL